MSDLFDAFWRALAYALHPSVLIRTLVPLALAGGAVFGLGWFFWEDAVTAVRAGLEQWEISSAMLAWMQAVGVGTLRSALAPLIVVAAAVPVVVVVSLLLVAWLMTPALVRRVVARRFPHLEPKGEAGVGWRGFGRSLLCAIVALAALLVTLPLWLVPPMALMLPAVIWGWLAAQVLGFDTLAQHATPRERHQVLRGRRWSLLAMGIGAGVLGALPSMLWVFTGIATLVFAPFVMVASVWLYTLVFAFSTLWFAHFTLAQLHTMRGAALSSTP